MSTPSTTGSFDRRPVASPNPAAIPTAAIPTSMIAAVARRYGLPEVIAIEEVPVPCPTESEVLVRVEAASLNALDWHFCTGTPYLLRLMNGLRRPRRQIPGADVAGTVVAVGSGVTDFAPGDPVFGESQGGGCSAYVAIDQHAIARRPEGVSSRAAGATPVAGLTALQGLRTHGAVQAGDQVLINGAAGGVGTFAVQIAKALGAEVTAVCSTRNIDMVRAIGADHVVDYTTTDVVTGGRRFDVMFDNVGNRSARQCLEMLRPDARYVIITGPKDNRWFGPVGKVISAALAFRRAEPSFHQFTASANRDDLDFLGELLADGRVVPQIQRVIGLGGVAEGLAEIGTGHTRAKIVFEPGFDGFDETDETDDTDGTDEPAQATTNPS